MGEFVKVVNAIMIGAVFIAGLIYGGWIAILCESIIALVYIICKKI